MCELCTQHGEGREWFLNRRNYSAELARENDSLGYMTHFLQHFDQSLFWEESLSMIKPVGWLSRLTYRVATAAQQANHLGQVLSLEDASRILELQPTIVRLPCPCKLLLTGQKVRRCLGLGFQIPGVLREVPEYDFEVLRTDEALQLLQDFDEQRLVRSVWTFKTPFIAALCNCDEDCMAWRLQEKAGVLQILYPGHERARVDWEKCNGCQKCFKQCPFKAIAYFSDMKKTQVVESKCYGCGVCRHVCEQEAIALQKVEI